MLITDLRELKGIMDIDPLDTSEDKKLLWLIEMATDIIEKWLNRSLSYKVRTQYYKGTGTQKLTLRNRPVYPTSAPSVAASLPFTAIDAAVNEQGYFGTASGSFSNTPNPMVFGANYTLEIDRDDGGSDSGILIRIGNYWPRPVVRQAGLLSPFVWDDPGSIQITYTAGYTVDSLPAQMRFAANLLVARMAYLMPLGMAVTSESYIDRNINLVDERDGYLLGLVAPHLTWFRNFKF